VGKWPARQAILTIKTVVDLFRLFRDHLVKLWERGDEQIIRNVIAVLDPGEDLISITYMYRVITSLLAGQGGHEEESGEKEAYCARLIAFIQERRMAHSGEAISPCRARL
jgi:hypothetical protein